MKKQAVNTFDGGMVTDIDELHAKPNTLTYARNTEYITTEGNQLILQKREGRSVKLLNVPVDRNIKAIEVIEDVAYIISTAEDGTAEIGTFPTPDYYSGGTPIAVTDDTIVNMLDDYHSLMNFLEGTPGSSTTDEDYNEPFITDKLNIGPDDYVSLELQKTYDGSVNLVIASENNPVRIINTKFKANGDGTATLIKRRLEKNDNVYSSGQFQKTEIIPRATTVGYIQNVEVREGGSLPAGGYRYYIKYITADGVETDVIEESRTIDIHYSNSVNIATGGDIGEIMPKMVKIDLTNLDKAFKGIRVYFGISAGEVQAATKLFQIDNTYDIDPDGNTTILHTGFEDTVDADPDTFALSYSQIKDSKLITKVNNRLALSGSAVSLKHKDEYAELASYFQITSYTDSSRVKAPIDIDGSDISDTTHANPETFYYSGEYWDAETYEIGVVFVTTEGSTPVYPVQGLDKVKDITGTYLKPNLGTPDSYFEDSNGQNGKGIYRTEKVDNFFNITGGVMNFKTVHLQIYTADFKSQFDADPDGEYGEIIGYYFVRKKRKKDALMRGLFTPTIAIPQITAFGYGNIIYTPSFWNGGRVGVDPILQGGYKRVPYPDMIMPYACRSHRKVPSDSAAVERMFDFQLRNIVHPAGAEVSFQSSFAFYSPDVDCNTTYSASAFSSRDFGTHIYRPSNMISGTKKSKTGTSFNKSGIYIHNTWIGPTSGTTISKERFSVGTLTFVTEDTLGAGAGAFAGNTDRNLWYYQPTGDLNNGYDITLISNTTIRNSSDDHLTDNIYDGDVDEDDKRIGGNSLKYGRYVGIKYKAEDYIRDLDLLEMHMPQKSHYANGANVNVDFTAAADGGTDENASPSASSMPTYFEPNDITGFLCTVYSGVNTSALEFDRWKEKYDTDDNSFYFAISRRYPVGTTESYLDLGDGDCYSGLAWKRVYRPRGIDEAPQTTDTKAYAEDYRDVGMADFGYAISIPTKSNYNFHLRVPSNEDDVEYDIFGQKRSFLPVQGKESIRGAKLDETDRYNHGYGANYESKVPMYRLNPDSPYYKAEQPNRVYVSDADIESNFVNGFTQFKGLSYRDYNSELGPINEMVTLNGRIVAVFDSGIATIGVDERSLIPGTEGDIFMDSAKALASKSEVKSTIIGSDQPKSVIATSTFVYGVDTKQYKIWRTNSEEFKVISDLKVQSWLKDTISALSSDSSLSFTVYTTYDTRKSELLFTFTQSDPDTGVEIASQSIVYNELLEIWVCETDENRTHLFYIEENKFATRPTFEPDIYEYSYSNNYINELNGEPVEKTVLEFIINKDQNEVKVLENLMIVGNSVLPDKINYTTDIYKRRENTPPLSQDIVSRTPVTLQIKSNVSVTNLGIYSLRFNDAGLNGINNPITDLPLDPGDLVTMTNSSGDVVKTKILAISQDGKDVDFADIVLTDATIDFYIGHRANIREYNTEIHEGITYLIPSCKADANITQPRGKWLKVNMELDGADQMYISGIASVYNQSLS
jgi:hypothetical protein